MAEKTKKGRIFSGIRPTGRLHLGNYFGALENWVNLQEDYECIFGIVDWHALTTDYEDPSHVQERVRELAIDFLSAGIDPEKSVMMVQSHVKQHAELHLLLSMVTPLGWVERVPTYKEQLRQLEGREIATYGFLGYPVLQAADIVIYKANAVPVGEDQLAHVELTREIVRRFNYLYGDTFPEPQALLHKVRLLPGIDGRKMSKSYGNEIHLGATEEELQERVRMMVTDPQRVRRHDPGDPDVCTVYAFYKIFGGELQEEIALDCRKARIGCVACKQRLAESLAQKMAPVRERRAALEADPALITDVLANGAQRARAIAERTMEQVRRAVGLS
ncbi:MAG TPA: tryptophan--tRNA ligase [Firmicutes bacterium]|jgi:tryptophanyl-tRNA synthetase|nr:tryptophan--tRNA ligase [Bacillota bacterium]